MSLSVLMSCYNTEKYIKYSILSILNQVYSQFEFLIIDDGSIDDTSAVVKSFLYDKRIRFFQKEHSGNWDTLNYGLKKSKFKYIAKLDSDDIAVPNRLYNQTLFLKKFNNINVLSGSVAFFSKKRICYVIKNPEYHHEIVNVLPIHSCIAHSGAIYDKNMVLDLGGYRNEIIEDYDLWLRLRDKARFHNSQEIITLMRVRNNSQTSIIGNEMRSLHKNLQNKYFQSYNLDYNLTTPKIMRHIKNEIHYGDIINARKLFFNKKDLLTNIINNFGLFLVLLLPQNMIKYVIYFKYKPKLLYYLNYFNSNYRYARKLIKH